MSSLQTVVKLAPLSFCIFLNTQSLAAISNEPPEIQTSLVDTTLDSRPHVVYVDALGRGGLWGLGYEYMAWKRFALGVTGSFYQLDDERYITLSPYLSYYPLSLEKHRWYMQLGPQFIRESTVSPVPEWNGIASSHFSGAFTTGYEYRSRFLLRVYGMAIVGSSGVLPWTGASVGWTF